MTYPDGIDALVNVNATDSLAAGGHAARHNSVNTALSEIKDMLGPSPAGKVMQFVRATDTTNRTTTSTSFGDVTGMSVTITPQTNTSAIWLLFTLRAETLSSTTGDQRGLLAITDSSNTAIAGGGGITIGLNNYNFTGTAQASFSVVAVAYATPQSTNAQTYKLRFRSVAATTTLTVANNAQTGTVYAVEVSA
jgi:hypothetical protein